MRLDHLLSRDLGACGGRGARTGASPGSSRGPSEGAGRTDAREHAPLSPCVLLGGWGVPASPVVGGWGHAVGVWGCVPFVSCFCFPLLCCCLLWWVLGVVCLCCVLFLWAFGGCLGTRGR